MSKSVIATLGIDAPPAQIREKIPKLRALRVADDAEMARINALNLEPAQIPMKKKVVKKCKM